jgi:hypothetical protein
VGGWTYQPCGPPGPLTGIEKKRNCCKITRSPKKKLCNTSIYHHENPRSLRKWTDVHISVPNFELNFGIKSAKYSCMIWGSYCLIMCVYFAGKCVCPSKCWPTHICLSISGPKSDCSVPGRQSWRSEGCVQVKSDTLFLDGGKVVPVLN